MRAASLLVFVAACGPMYPEPKPQPPSSPQPQVSGPPGGGAEPWAEPAPPPRALEPEPARRVEPSPPRAEPPPPRPAPSSGAPAAMQDILEAHNRVRAKHCAAPLTWSTRLQQAAQQWANSLRDQGCKFGHSGGKYGENLAAGTAGTLDGSSVLRMWYDEVKLYDFRSGSFSMETGHFTQVVWRGTTQLGCAVATCKGMDIWVCEYDPPGNVHTLFQRNVVPEGCR